MPDTESFINSHRPNSWDQVVGQTALVHALRQAIIDRVAHSFILSGPSGTGKTTCARLMAKQLGCNVPVEIDAAHTNSVEDTRFIIDQLKYKPVFEEDVRVYIVDEAHALSRQAFTSLLKSIEEPPAHVFWMLCSTDPDKIPKTIRTRAFHAQFKSVGFNDLLEFLVSIRDKEGLGTSLAILDECVKEADGSPRQALSNFAVCYTAKNGEEASLLLRSASAEPEIIEIAKLLLNGAPWPKIQAILVKLQDVNPESARRSIGGYISKVLLNTSDEDKAMRLFQILDQFSTPWYDNNGMTPLIMAVGRSLFST